MSRAARDLGRVALGFSFADKVYSSTSVADISPKAGANADSRYHYFPTKQDVLVAVLDLY